LRRIFYDDVFLISSQRKLVALLEERGEAPADYDDKPKPSTKPKRASFRESLAGTMEEVRGV